MRALLAALLATTALPALGDTLTAESTITAVTVYPDGARITREVRVAIPAAGPHELLVTDLPALAEAGLMRLSAGDGLALGAFSLRSDRLPPREDPQTPAQEAAMAALDAAIAEERQAIRAVDALRARVAAAEARIAFLASFGGTLPETATPDSLKAMADTIGTESLAAHEAAVAARADLWPAEDALARAQEARASAEAALAALPARDADYTALVVAVEAAAPGDQLVTVTHYISGAYWRPSYELNLTRAGGDVLTVDRSMLVTQYTGEDWSGVELTLSTARPADQAAPSPLWPDLRQIGEKIEEEAYRTEAADAMGAGVPAAEPVAAPAPAIVAVPGIEGDTVVYTYARKVDVASGVEDLRLPLDRIELAPVVYAAAVPRWDRTAFVLAEVVNTSGQPLLPGDAVLLRDGVLVGGMQLGFIAAGAETDIAFGALESVQLSREMPLRDSGQSGVFTTSNEASEEAVLVIENLGEEAWPLRVLDQVPYSEQQDLEIVWSASPEPTEVDVDGQRGILAWEFDLAPGEKRQITLGHALTWPDGMVLR
jgi:uncharacterized protein (TIGR02231 family)